MKKTILIMLFACLCFSVKAQIKDTIGMNIPVVDNKIIYESIIDAPGKTKNDLYENAQQWFVDYFKSAKDVIQNQDKENGIVVGKGAIDVYAHVGFGMSATQHDKMTIKISCKDGKYKYSIYDMVMYPQSWSEAYSATYDDMMGKLTGRVKMGGFKSAIKDNIVKNDIKIREMIESIKAAMVSKSSDF